MLLLVITTILWAFSFSLIGEYLAGHVDSWFSVLMRIGLAALVFLPFLRWRNIKLKVILLYMLVGAFQLGIMYLISFRAYLYLTVPEFLLFTVLTPLYITLIYDLLSGRRLRWGYVFSALLAVLGAARKRAGPRTVVVVLTGSALRDDRARAEALDADLFVTKPVGVDAYVTEMRRFRDLAAAR